MTAAENKDRLRRVFEEGINQNKPDVVDELISPDYVNHDLPAPGPGPEGLKQVVGMFRAAFPDMRIAVEDMVAEDDKVAARHRFRGTQTGPMGSHPPSGRVLASTYLAIYRIEDSRIAEAWVEWDNLHGLRQLGHVPRTGS